MRLNSVGKRAATAIVVAVAALLAVARPAGAAQAKWTVLVYLDADNDLEGAAILNMNQMEMVGSSPDVSVLVQIDRTPGYDDTNGDWADTRRYYVTRDSDTETIGSTLVSGVGEKNMGSPTELVNFVKWGVQNYPADHYLLILWDHGDGWRKGSTRPRPIKGIAYDETNGDYLSIADLRQAFSQIHTFLGRKLDIVACDACLMQMIEVAYELRDSVALYVSSEETVPYTGFPYHEWLARLVANPTMAASALCQVLVDSYVDFYDTMGPPECCYVTLSAVDLTRMPAVASAVDALGQALSAGMGSNCEEILSGWSSAQCYDDYDSKDIYHLAQELLEYVPNQAIGDAAQSLMSAVGTAVICNRDRGTRVGDSHGLSIYYPEADYYEAVYDGLQFAADTSWDEYIQTSTPCHSCLPDAYEPDDGSAYASTLQLGQPQANHWCHLAGDVDWMRFQAQADKLYCIDTQHMGRLGDTVLRLLDVDGVTELAMDDDSGPEPYASRIVFFCGRADQYYTSVAHYYPDIFGMSTNYDVCVTQVRFVDVLPEFWAFSHVEACAAAFIVSGYPDLTYRPEEPVSRAQMAVYISRAMAKGDANVPPGPPQASFPDVPAGDWAYRYVEYAHSHEIVNGYPDGLYHPDWTVDRGQMAVFVARAVAWPTGLADYTPPSTPTFPDVTASGSTSWCYTYVEYIADPARGVTQGYLDGRYRPDNTCTRDQMAVYIARGFKLPL